MKTVTLYYAPSCAFSAATIAFLTLRGADFRVVNLDEHEDVRRRLEGEVEALETPTLDIDGALHVAPPLSELKELLSRAGLPEAAAPHQQLEDAQ